MSFKFSSNGCGELYDREIDSRVFYSCKILGATGNLKCNVNLSVAAKLAAYKEVLLPTLKYSSGVCMYVYH